MQKKRTNPVASRCLPTLAFCLAINLSLPAQAGEVCFQGKTSGTGVCLKPRTATPNELTDQYQYGDPFKDSSFPPKANPQLYLAPQKYLDLKKLDPQLALSPKILVSQVLNTVRYPFGLFSPSSVSYLTDVAQNLPFAMTITSGYRSPGYNATLPGAAKWSRHLYGDAVDIAAAGKEISQVEAVCTKMGASFTQIYSDHVHCDWRLVPLPPAYFEATRRPFFGREDYLRDLAQEARVQVEFLPRSLGNLSQPVRLIPVAPIQEDSGELLSRFQLGRRIHWGPNWELELPRGSHSIDVWVGGSLKQQVNLQIP